MLRKNILILFVLLYCTFNVFAGEVRYEPPHKSALLAGLCSAFTIVGGQFYNGEVLKGILMLLVFSDMNRSGFSNQYNISGEYFWFVGVTDAIISAGEINKKYEMGGYQRYKSPDRAMFWGLIFPGGGQLYNGEFTKTLTYILIAGGYAALMGDKVMEQNNKVPLQLLWLYSIIDARSGAGKANQMIDFKSSFYLVPDRNSIFLVYNCKFH